MHDNTIIYRRSLDLIKQIVRQGRFIIISYNKILQKPQVGTAHAVSKTCVTFNLSREEKVTSLTSEFPIALLCTQHSLICTCQG